MEDKFALAKKAEDFAARWDEELRPSLNDWFQIAWAREIPELIPMDNRYPTLNLGAGNRQIGISEPLDLEHGWRAEEEDIPHEDSSVGGIWAHGFFEHLSPETAIVILRECDRVLVPGCPLNIVVPHGMSELWHEEIEHLSTWHEATIPNLFRNPYYQRGSEHNWGLSVHTIFMMGVVYRNLALMIQLKKD